MSYGNGFQGVGVEKEQSHSQQSEKQKQTFDENGGKQQQQKSETRLTASVLKQDPNT